MASRFRGRYVPNTLGNAGRIARSSRPVPAGTPFRREIQRRDIQITSGACSILVAPVPFRKTGTHFCGTRSESGEIVCPRLQALRAPGDFRAHEPGLVQPEGLSRSILRDG
jgi:hypothetical protein